MSLLAWLMDHLLAILVLVSLAVLAMNVWLDVIGELGSGCENE